MNILILNPPFDVPIIREGRCQSPQNMRKTSIPQMTLAYLANVLESDIHNVLALDCIADDIGIEDLFKRLDSFKPQLALINTTTPSFVQDMEFVKQLKNKYNLCVMAVFGTHVTSLYEETIKNCSHVDVVLLHEPELPAKNLLNSLEKDVSLSGGVDGCAVRGGDGSVVAGKAVFAEDLDLLGFPAWQHFDINQYQHPVLNKPYLTVNTSRGCAHNCIFCVGHIFYGKKMRYRTINSILKEIEEHVIGRFKVDLIWFYADDFTASPQFVKDLCREILKRKLKITWWTNTRVDKPDKEMFQLMKDAGCYMLSIGGESGNADILKTIRKGTKPEFIRNTVSMLRSVGINSLVYFLIGLPGENRSTIQETINFAKSINPDYVEFYPATPYPGTDFFSIAQKQGLIVDEDWRGYMCGGDHFVIRIPDVNKDELNSILRSAYRQFYLRPAYVALMIRRFIKNPKEFLRLCSFGIGYIKRFLFKDS